MLEIFLYCLGAGSCAGLLAGLFGIGGGIILVPILIWLFKMQSIGGESLVVMAIATSLATINITSISSVYAHHRLGAIHWQTVMRLAPGILIGSIIGTVIADQLPGKILKLFFAIYLLIVALQMALQIKPKADSIHFSAPVLISAGGVIGTLSAILGIGGGTLTVPFLVKCRLPMRNAVAISSACGLPIAVAGTLSYALLGWHKTNLPMHSFGYVYLPAFFGIIFTSVLFAPIGAKLAHTIPTQTLKRIFAVFLFIVGIRLLW